MQSYELFDDDKKEATIRNFQIRVSCIRAFLMGVRPDPDPLPDELNARHLSQEELCRRILADQLTPTASIRRAAIHSISRNLPA